jgi:hypothetical protein
MIRSIRPLLLLGAATALVGPSLVAARAQPPDALAQPAVWQPADAEQVREQAWVWLEERQIDEATRAKAAELWPADAPPSSGVDLLSRLAQTFALVDEDARKLVDLCSKPRSDVVLPGQAWLADPETPPLVANNLRLLYGRWLAHELLFDEALEQLAGLRPDDVADPATLLFYQSVVHHRLLDPEAAMAALERLLTGAEQSPRRYVAVARLMEADLKDLQPDSLDHIARRMEDVRRRLDLGRAGNKVRRIEEGVIESLDKLIDELEKQRQQCQAAESGNLQPANPAEESRPMGGKGPGRVTKRDIGSGSGWGDLPPRAREEALQQVGREFPSHYRDVIEQYFRKLASEGSR